MYDGKFMTSMLTIIDLLQAITPMPSLSSHGMYFGCHNIQSETQQITHYAPHTIIVTVLVVEQLEQTIMVVATIVLYVAVGNAARRFALVHEGHNVCDGGHWFPPLGWVHREKRVTKAVASAQSLHLTVDLSRRRSWKW